MKKSIFSIALCLVLLLSMSTQALAAESGEIKVTYSQPDPEKVTVVDITWGSMEFNYTETVSSQVWNPNTLKYETVGGDGESKGSWAPKDTGGDTVTVTNHSNTSLLVTVTYTPANENGVNGTLKNGSFLLSTAVGTTTDKAPEGSAKLTLDNTSVPASWSTSGATTIGNITVTLDHCDAVASSPEELNAALENGGSIVLTADISNDTNAWSIYTDTTIDLNGHTITGKGGVFGAYECSVTIQGEGKLTVTEDWDNLLSVTDGGILNISGGEIITDSTAVCAYGGSFVNITGGSVTGTVQVDDGSSLDISDGTITGYLNILDNCVATISGGTIDAYINVLYGSLTITGGTFTKEDPSYWVPEGYVVTENADGSWTVTEN